MDRNEVEEVEVEKTLKKKGLRLIISHLDRISLVNKRFIIKQKDFALLGINNAFCFESQERKPTVFFSTVNQGQSFMSSLPWLPSAFFFFFFYSFTDIVQKITNFVSLLYGFFFLRGIKACNPKRARRAHLLG